ncbi:MAG: hypothetical protein AB7F96_12335 [Beijerinckiaceae bacterium]
MIGLFALIFLIAAGAAGYFSWKWKLLPDAFLSGKAVATAPQSSADSPANPANETKIAGRAEPGGQEPAPQAPAAQTPSEPAPAEKADAPETKPEAAETRPEPEKKQEADATPAPPPAPAPSNNATAPDSSQAVAVAQRGALLIQSSVAEKGSNVKSYTGTVVWSGQNLSRGSGQPLSFGVRAELNVPEAKFRATMTIEKNTDATLPASHMITWRFERGEDSPIPPVSQIGVLQMHDENSQVADPLSGAQAKITSNIYIIALAAPEALLNANMDTLRKRGWFILPIKLGDDREARISLEKGRPGSNILTEAFKKWGMK